MASQYRHAGRWATAKTCASQDKHEQWGIYTTSQMKLLNMKHLKMKDVQALCSTADLHLTARKQKERNLHFCTGCVRYIQTLSNEVSFSSEFETFVQEARSESFSDKPDLEAISPVKCVEQNMSQNVAGDYPTKFMRLDEDGLKVSTVNHAFENGKSADELIVMDVSHSFPDDDSLTEELPANNLAFNESFTQTESTVICFDSLPNDLRNLTVNGNYWLTN